MTNDKMTDVDMSLACLRPCPGERFLDPDFVPEGLNDRSRQFIAWERSQSESVP